MKQLALIFLLSIICITAFANEPGHHLCRTVEQIKLEYSELEFWNYENGMPVYRWETPTSISYFVFKNGHSIKEGHMFIGGTDLEYYAQYRLLVSEFTNNTSPLDIKSVNSGNTQNVVFYYSYFTVCVQYLPNEYTVIEYRLLSSFN